MQFIKQVLASVLGTIIAFILGFFILLILIVGAATSVMLKASHEKKEVYHVKPNSIVTLDLNYEMKERTKDDVLSSFNFSKLDVEQNLGLTDVLNNIRKAKTDDNVKGIYLDLSNVSAGIASVEAIRNELIDFKKSGKFIIAYGEVITQKAYYLASVADKIYISPVGLVEFKGFGTSLMFIKNMLDKLEIEPQIFYCGKYKSATEPLRFTQMSDANREQVNSYLQDVYKLFLKNISESRKIEVATLDSLANNLIVRSPQDAKNNKLVDSLVYYDQVLADMKSRVGATKDKDLNLVTMNKYNNAPAKQNNSGSTIAVVYAQGNIVDGEGDEDNIGSETFAKAIRDIRNNDDIKGLVLRINSGGGSALASDIILREIKLAKQKMPVIVSMGDVAASGGYYIACAADTIVAQPNTITGSIGVFGILPNMQGFFKDKLGITYDKVSTGKYTDMGNPARPLNDAEKMIIQAGVDSIYYTFKSRVSEGRHRSIEYIDSIAQGRVWTGTQAKELGLVDVMGGLDDALKIAANKAGLKDYKTEDYPKTEDTFTKLFGNMEDEASVYFTKRQLGDMYPVWKQMEELKTMTGIQARVPYSLDIH